MKLLAIDTATEACSAALLINDDIISRYQFAPRKHAELILPMVDELLAEAGLRLADLDALAFGRGPGAFTGVRIAAGVIQGLAYATNLPVIPISTLAALAQGVDAEHQHIISAIDARMGEIYWGLYTRDDAGQIVAASDEVVSKPEDLVIADDVRYFGTGSGWKTYASVLTDKLQDQLTGFADDRFPDARDILTLAQTEFEHGRTVSADQALPVYLRNKVTG
jgi:tRNA threonylcarbamoyladenosine biosynthesis protein TsaB